MQNNTYNLDLAEWCGYFPQSQDGSVVAIAGNSQSFINEVVQLYSNKEVWEQRQYKALAYAKENFSPEVVREELDKLLSLPKSEKKIAA